MKQLYETLRDALDSHAAQMLSKHFSAVGIGAWEDLDREHLYALVDELSQTVAPSSAHSILGRLKGIIRRGQDQIPNLPSDWRGILVSRGEKAVKTYLTPEELDDLAKVETKSDFQKAVLYNFLISAKTGARISDTLRLTSDNIKGGMLDYVSQKTKVHATVPVSSKTLEMIRWVRTNYPHDIPDASYNRTVRQLCERAGINESVKVFKAGQTKSGPKYLFCSSHTARISFVTNLAVAGVPVADISQLCGHKNIVQTSNYIARHEIKLSDEAMRLLR